MYEILSNAYAHAIYIYITGACTNVNYKNRKPMHARTVPNIYKLAVGVATILQLIKSLASLGEIVIIVLNSEVYRSPKARCEARIDSSVVKSLN